MTTTSERFAPDANIETALARGIASLRANRTGQEQEAFWMSGLGLCPRRQVGQRAGIAPSLPPDQRSQFKMWAGTTLHAGIQQVLVQEGFLEADSIEQRVRLESNGWQPYVGKLDGLTKRFGDQGAVVEIKTSDDDAVARYDDMPVHYLWQAAGLALAAKVSHFLILQLGRNQGLAKHRFYSLNQSDIAELLMEIDDHLEDMTHHWEHYKLTGELPPCRHRFRWEDKLCAYRPTTEGSNGAARPRET